MGWVKSTLEGKEFWTLDSSDPAKLEALKSARKLIDERKDLVSLKIEGAAKALEQERKEKEERSKKVQEKFVTDREDFAEIQEIRGGVKASMSEIGVKETPICVRPTNTRPSVGQEEEEPTPAFGVDGKTLVDDGDEREEA
eukprot:TRINITY_DN6006_c0_g1_i2.p1 TRINITY_DN6006_c0_g1~~TRINITY_DN6006_c0_g1_i2.p1  ORF type:complete len:141 (+),score=54.30 TRINITY_DN6006_c0_g1_i2:440-862(+)